MKTRNLIICWIKNCTSLPKSCELDCTSVSSLKTFCLKYDMNHLRPVTCMCEWNMIQFLSCWKRTFRLGWQWQHKSKVKQCLLKKHWDVFHIMAYLKRPNSSFVDSTSAVSVTQGKPKISTVSVSYSAGAGSRRNSSLQSGCSHIS